MKQQLQSIAVMELRPGHLVVANDGTSRRVLAVDPVLDPRGGTYESTTTEVIAKLQSEDAVVLELFSGTVNVAAA